MFREGLNQTVGGKRRRVVRLVVAKLICVQLVITVTFLKSEGTTSKEICNVSDGFTFERIFDMSIPVAGGLYD